MQRVSSNATLFFKFFVPIFWIVFFGSVTMAVFLSKASYVGNFPMPPFRIGIGAFFFSGLLVFVFTLMRLKRVEFSDQQVYITNYFKAARYPWRDVAEVRESDFLFMKIVTIELKARGLFGKRIFFLASSRLLNGFWEEHPHLRLS